LGISSLQYSSDRSIKKKKKKKKKSGNFFTIISDLFHWIHLFALITFIHIIFSENFFFLPRPPLFSSPILMAHTRSQDLEARFNTLQSGLIETQQEVKQLSANVAAINTTMQSSMGEIKQDLTTQLESVFSALCTKLHIPTDNPSSSSPPHTEGDHSSHSHTLQNHHFQRDLRLPWVDVTKFDGSDPTGWVTQMEHYFSLYNITDDLAKLRYGVLHLDQERWQWWQWRKNSRQGYIAWTQFVAELYECFDTDTNHLGHLTKLKQLGTVEDFIAAFERLAFRTEGMSDAFFESVLSAASRMKFGPMSSWLGLRVGWRLPKEIKKHNRLYLLKTANPPSSLALNQ
jgi:hypothetical protein